MKLTGNKHYSHIRCFILFYFSLVFLCSPSCYSHYSYATDNAHYNQHYAMIPASIEKTITAWLAWNILGPDHTYETTLLSCSDNQLSLQFSFDPTLEIKDIKKIIAPYNRTNQSLTLVPNSLAEPYHPRWLIEDSIQHYSQPLSPWIFADKISTVSLEDLAHSIDWKGIPLQTRLQKMPHCQVVAIHKSLPLKQILPLALQQSNNLVMDSLWLKIAERIAQKPISNWAQASHIIQNWLKEHYPKVAHNAYLQDGSGLSRMNLITAQAMLTVLHEIRRDNDFYSWLMASLPIAGTSGTMKARFLNVAHPPIIAKTGGMTGIRTLAGWIVTSTGPQPFVWLESFIDEYTDDEKIFHLISQNSDNLSNSEIS